MNKISILFLGDIAFNGVFIDQFKRKYNPFKNLLFLTHKLKPIWSFYFFIHRKINPVIFYFKSNDKSVLQKIQNLNWDKIKRQILK